jgi:dTDP-4-amino-4,6-dideoxygalactose transaminase
MSELHAAFGLSMLDSIDSAIEKRRATFARLRLRLASDSRLRFPTWNSEAVDNGTYCPIVFESESATLHVLSSLATIGVEARRYFYPALNTLPHFKREQRLPIAEDISRRILCVGFNTWSEQDLDRIADAILSRRDR